MNDSNNQDMDTSYKQSRIEIEMSNEKFKIGFEKDNTGLDFALNLQQDHVEINSLMSHILQRNGQIDNINSDILKDRHHIENLIIEIKNEEIKRSNEKKERVELIESNNTQMKLINETINLKHEINNSFIRLINAMREDNQTIINTIGETSKLTREQIAQASLSIRTGIVNASDQMSIALENQSSRIVQQLKKNSEEMIRQLTTIDNAIKESNRLKLLLLDKMQNIMNTLAELKVKVTNAEQTALRAIEMFQEYRFASSYNRRYWNGNRWIYY